MYSDIDQLSSLMTYEFLSQFRTIKVDLPHVRSRMSISALLTTWLSKSPNQLRELAQQDMFAFPKEQLIPETVAKLFYCMTHQSLNKSTNMHYSSLEIIWAMHT